MKSSTTNSQQKLHDEIQLTCNQNFVILYSATPPYSIIGSRSFHTPAPAIWNSLPDHSVHLVHSTLPGSTSKHPYQPAVHAL